MFVGAIEYTENWSAFAPDFKELEENEEYIEREDEFDEVAEDLRERKEEGSETELVDIITVDKAHFASSDEEEVEDEVRLACL